MDARTLKLLRLNQITNAIEDFQGRMNSMVSGLADWDNLTDKQNRLRRDKWLKTVKAYYQNYPVQGEDADKINSFLAKIPGSNPATTNAAPQ